MNHITNYTALDFNNNKTNIVSANKGISRFYTMKQNSKYCNFLFGREQFFQLRN